MLRLAFRQVAFSASAALALFGQAAPAAAGSAGAQAGAIIVPPATVTARTSLWFGTIATSPTTAGQATVSPTGAARCDRGAVCLSGDQTAAVILVSAPPGAHWTLRLPSQAVLETAGGAALTVTGLVAAPVQATGGVAFAVGGSAQIAAGQPPGPYSGSFEVVADYE